MKKNLEVWRLLEGGRLLERGAYFNVDTQKVRRLLEGGAYLRPGAH